MPWIAEMAVSGTAYTFDKLFSYAVPDSMAGSLEKGCRVILGFGRTDQLRTGIVMKLYQGDNSKFKPILEQIDQTPVISQELMELAVWLKDHTFCTYFEAVKSMLPPAMSVVIQENFRLCKNFRDDSLLSPSGMELLCRLRDACGKKEFTLAVKSAKRSLLNELTEAGAIESDNVFRQNVGDASVRMVRLTQEYLECPENFQLTPKQKTAADFLAECGSASVKELAYMCGVTTAVVQRLAVNGAAEEYLMEVLRSVDPHEQQLRKPEDIILSHQQQNAHDAVLARIFEGKPGVFLLHGVTGSGKTSVFEKLIWDTVKMGKQALLLIPEIGLTPQILRRFRGLFGEKVAVIHSGLSLGQRLDEYKRIKRGECSIVIGTRSAVFAPLEKIGLIIMDEEGERSYKSDSSPRYNTVDVAKQRCLRHNAVLLLASATPSIESYYYAEKGVYKLLEMDKRFHDSPLPKVEIVDMNIERSNGNRSEFSQLLVDAINENLSGGHQTILLLNRRGYHTIISCSKCSQPLYCPNCSVPLTYHKVNNRLMCHYCGFSSQTVQICPVCGSGKLKSMGFGTQRLEEELNMFFPSARILRMDADTTFSRYSYEKNFDAFRKGEYDIMIGTQMIGKGLDFPNVTLVGVLSVDKALYAGDFRSYERTFSLITQVVGRSGRGDVPGRAVLQTFMPEHYVMNLAADQNYKEFYNEEIAIRRAMIFPPVCDMCVFCLSAAEEGAVKKAADAVMELMNVSLSRLQPKTPVRVLGPVKCSYGKINGKFRYRILMKCKNNVEMRDFINTVLLDSAKLRELKGVTFYADMNGDAGV